jgi:hypothetical protein
MIKDNIIIEYYNNNINTSNENLKSETSKVVKIVSEKKVRNHMEIVNEYENL